MSGRISHSTIGPEKGDGVVTGFRETVRSDKRRRGIAANHVGFQPLQW